MIKRLRMCLFVASVPPTAIQENLRFNRMDAGCNADQAHPDWFDACKRNRPITIEADILF